MSVTVSAEFKALWQQKHGTVEKRRVLYNRIYWNGAAYVYEYDETDSTNWHVLSEADFVDFGDIPCAVDSPLENIFRTGVVALQVENTNNQWKQSAEVPSLFAADGTALLGYKLKRSLFRLQTGYVLHADTTEWCTVFTGMVIKPLLNSRDGYATIQLGSKSAYRLEKSDASKVSTTVTLENCIPPTGDGANKAFETTSTGIDHINDVQVDGVSLDSTEYSIGNLNNVAVPGNTGRASLTMQTAPGNTKTVKASLLKWLQSQKINDVLTLIANQASIPTAEQQFDPVILAGNGSEIIDSQADFEAYDSKTNVSTTAVIGSIKKKWFLIDDFTDLDFTAGPIWTVEFSNAATLSAATGALVCRCAAAQTAWIDTPFNKAYGTFRFRAGWAVSAAAAGLNAKINFIKPTAGATNNGYSLNFNGVSGRITLELNGVTLVDCGAYGGGMVEYRVTRTSAGVFTVYAGGVQIGTATDNSVITGGYFGLSNFSAGAGDDGTITLDDIYWSEEIDSAGVVSTAAAVITYIYNLLSTPAAMGILQATQDLNGGSVTYKTAGAPDAAGVPGAWDALVAVSANGQQNNTPRQWLKIEIDISSNGFDSPEIKKVVSNFSTSDVILALAVHSGLTGSDAIEQYAGLVDYETGDRNSGARFFRSKTTAGDPIIELTQENGIIEITEWDDGTDDIINVAAVRAGNNFSSYDCDTAAEAHPNPLDDFGRCLPSGGEISLPPAVLANNLNITKGRAQTLHDRKHKQKIKIRAIIWAIPWAEVGDKIRASLYDNPLMKQTVAGDPLQVISNGTFANGNSQNVLCRNTDFKLLEYKPNYGKGIAEIYAEEILS